MMRYDAMRYDKITRRSSFLFSPSRRQKIGVPGVIFLYGGIFVSDDLGSTFFFLYGCSFERFPYLSCCILDMRRVIRRSRAVGENDTENSTTERVGALGGTVTAHRCKGMYSV